MDATEGDEAPGHRDGDPGGDVAGEVHEAPRGVEVSRPMVRWAARALSTAVSAADS